MMARELLFSVTKADLRVDTFRAGGKGGQNQNKRETGVRIVHLASGAVGEARDTRSQDQNKAAAFRRMIETPAFRRWQKLETARRVGQLADIEVEVERLMAPENIRTEVRRDGRWISEPVPE